MSPWYTRKWKLRAGIGQGGLEWILYGQYKESMCVSECTFSTRLLSKQRATHLEEQVKLVKSWNSFSDKQIKNFMVPDYCNILGYVLNHLA